MSKKAVNSETPGTRAYFEVHEIQQKMRLERIRIILTFFSVWFVVLGIGVERYLTLDQRNYEWAAQFKMERVQKMHEIAAHIDQLGKRTLQLFAMGESEEITLPSTLAEFGDKLYHLENDSIIGYGIPRGEFETLLESELGAQDASLVMSVLDKIEMEGHTDYGGQYDVSLNQLRERLSRMENEGLGALSEEAKKFFLGFERIHRRTIQDYVARSKDILSAVQKDMHQLEHTRIWAEANELSAEWESARARYAVEFSIYFDELLVGQWNALSIQGLSFVRNETASTANTNFSYELFRDELTKLRSSLASAIVTYQSQPIESVSLWTSTKKLFGI